MSQTIAERAYEIYLREGQPVGRDFDHWLQAEKEMQDQQGKSSKARGRKTTVAQKSTGAKSRGRRVAAH